MLFWKIIKQKTNQSGLRAVGQKALEVNIRNKTTRFKCQHFWRHIKLYINRVNHQNRTHKVFFYCNLSQFGSPNRFSESTELEMEPFCENYEVHLSIRRHCWWQSKTLDNYLQSSRENGDVIFGEWTCRLPSIDENWTKRFEVTHLLPKLTRWKRKVMVTRFSGIWQWRRL